MKRRITAVASLLAFLATSRVNVVATEIVSPLLLQQQQHDAEQPRNIRFQRDNITLSIDMEDLKMQEFNRALAIGDFARFNELFKDASIKLPDADVGSGGLDLEITNLICEDLNVGDIQLSYSVITGTNFETLAVNVNVGPFAMNCRADYKYKFSFFARGDGSFKAESINNRANVRIDLNSPSTFQQSPPRTVDVETCNANINVDKVNFSGGFVASILNLFEDLIAGVIEREAQDAACDELTELGPGLFGNFLDLFTAKLDTWLQPIPANLADPLFAEQNFVVPDGARLINLRETSPSGNSTGDLLVQLLNEAESMFGGQVEDITSPTGTNLGINKFMRDSLLDENGVFVFRFDDVEVGNADFDPILYEGHDKLTQTVIRMNTAEIVGLDTMTYFSPLQVIGDYTIRNELKWDALALRLNVTVDIKPSSRPDSILVNPSPVNIIENITVAFALDDLDVNASLFLAINEGRFDDLTLGGLLATPMDCLLSSADGLEVSGLEISMAALTEPVLSNFVSPGIDRVVSTLVEAAFVGFEPTLYRAIPHFFQGPVRNLLKDSFFDDILSGDMDPCEVPAVSEPYVDFRDLFLKPEQSIALGGSGQEPYGGLSPMAYDLIQDQFVGIDESGAPGINEILIRPFTQRQSGVDGTMSFMNGIVSPSRKRDLEQAGLIGLQDTFVFNVSDIRLSNLDTVSAPLELLNPTSSAYVLDNMITMGLPGRPLTVTARLVAGLLDGLNEIDITATFDTVTLDADLSLIILSDAFLDMPLAGLLDLNCWLATVLSVELDENGKAVDPLAQRGISLESVAVSLSSLAIGSQCVSCPSSGTSLLSEAIQIVQDVGAIETLRGRIPEFVGSISTSNTLQTVFDRLGSDAAKFCPSSFEYDSNAARTEYESIGFPSLSSTSIDTLLFSGMIAAQIGLVFLAEIQRNHSPKESDPLSAQNSFVAPEGVRLIDWTDIGNSTDLGVIVDQVFGQARQFLNGEQGGLLDFSRVLDGVLDESGALELDLDFGFERDGFSLSLQSLRIKGLDSFSIANALEPIAPQTLQTNIIFGSLELEFEITADSPATSAPPQIISLQLEAQSVSADISTFAAFDIDKLFDLELGSLLDTRTLAKCILSTAYAIEFPQLSVTVGSLSTPKVSGLMPDTAAATDLSIEAIFGRFQSDIVEAIPAIFDGVGKDFLSGALSSFSDNKSCSAASLEASSEASFVDFRDLILPKDESAKRGGSGRGQYGNLVSTAYDLFKRELFVADPETGLAKVNKGLIAGLTKAQSGTPGRLFFPGDIFNTGQRVQAGGLDANIAIRLYDAHIDNLDTFGLPLTVLDPVHGEAHMLNNSAVAGVGDTLQAGIKFFLELSNDESDISNEVEITIGMDSLQLLATGIAKMSEGSFLKIPVRDVANLQCWLAAIPAPELNSQGVAQDKTFDPSLALTDFMASVSRLGLNVTCLQCSGSKISEFSKLLSTQDGTDAVTDFANGVFGFLTDVIEGNYLQVVADRALSDARKRCPHSPFYEKDFAPFDYEPFPTSKETESSSAFFVALVVVTAGLFLCGAAFFLTAKLVVRRRHRRWVASLPQTQVMIMKRIQMKEDEVDTKLASMTKAMFLSDCIPLWLRLAMPVIILGNIGFFLSGHLSLGASVTILASVGGQLFSEEGFFAFSMARSTMEIWNAGAQELAILIFVFSFAWPYTKQLVTLVLWFAPPSTVPVQQRGSILLWLDALAKWSMIDIFVLIVTIASFRVSIKSPDVGFLPPNFYSIDLLVAPKWGLYANMTAQIISQLSSHWIIHYHRLIVHTAAPHLDSRQRAIRSSQHELESGSADLMMEKGSDIRDDPLRKDRLHMHAFKRPHRGVSDKLVVRRCVSPILLSFSALLCILIVVGCLLPSYSVEALGIIGVLVESGFSFANEARSEYSVITTIVLLFDQAKVTAKTSDYIGLGSLSILLVLSVLVVPVLQCMVLIVQWLLPLTKKQRYRVSIILEILQAWQYAEVYLLAVLVASWQIGPISEFMINPYCISLEKFLSELVYYGILKAEDAQCFRADIGVEPTFFILFAATVVLALINSFVMKAVCHYFRDNDPQHNLTSSLAEASDDVEALDEGSSQSSRGTALHPTPVLFTDQFRWFLHREDAARVGTMPASYRSDENSSGDENEASQIKIFDNVQNDGASMEKLEEIGMSEEESHCYDWSVASGDKPAAETGKLYVDMNQPQPSFANTTLTLEGFGQEASGVYYANGALLLGNRETTDDQGSISSGNENKPAQPADIVRGAMPATLSSPADVVSPSSSDIAPDQVVADSLDRDVVFASTMLAGRSTVSEDDIVVEPSSELVDFDETGSDQTPRRGLQMT